MRSIIEQTWEVSQAEYEEEIAMKGKPRNEAALKVSAARNKMEALKKWNFGKMGN